MPPRTRTANVHAAQWSPNGGSLGQSDLTQPGANVFGENVFSTAVQRQRLPKAVYAQLEETLEAGELLEPALADAVAGTLDRSEVLAGLTAAGLGRRSRATGNDTSPAALADALLAEAAGHGARVAMEHRERAALLALGRPTYELPALPTGVDLGALYGLAERLRDQGMA